MKKTIITSILLCLLCGSLKSQSWVIDFHGDYPLGRTHFNTGFVDEEGVTFLAGQQGPDRDTHETILMRIDPDGNHSEYIYHEEGFLSEAHCILETPDHHLFLAGRIFDENDDYILTLILDKELNLLREDRYEKEVEATKFEMCTATTDTHGNIIVATSVEQPHAWGGAFHRGVFLKYDSQGELTNRHYLIADYPDPLYYLMRFQVRQMWYREQEETLLCLVPGYGNIMSFITFDSSFNYIDEHPIWRETDGVFLDHYLNEDGYTDHWLSENEALFFSSRGDYEHSKLRVSRITTNGDFNEFIQLNERPDTIDEAAKHRCMATANDSTMYFSFFQHAICFMPGTATIYRLNNRLEITGRYIDDQHDFFRSYLIFPTNDGGCITVNDSCDWDAYPLHSHPKITKLQTDNFETIFLDVTTNPLKENGAFPNPANNVLTIPLDLPKEDVVRCRVCDHLGRIVIDQSIPNNSSSIRLDISHLKAGTYFYQVFTTNQTLLQERFIKK